ncbi:hypothetical protein SEUCBS139899_002382 [Sporothrix eucalyptigena]
MQNGRKSPSALGSHIPSGSDRRDTRHGRSGPRSRLGCVTCKQRRVRCDEAHPVCGHCRRLQLDCWYQAPGAGKQQRKQQLQRPPQPPLQSQSQSQSQLPLQLPLHSHQVGDVGESPFAGLLPPAASVAANETSPDDGHVDHSLLRRGGRQRSQMALPDVTAPDLWTYARSGYATPNGNSHNNHNNNNNNNNNSNNNNNGLPWTPARRYDFFDIFAELDTSWAGEFSCVLPEVQTPLDQMAAAAEQPQLDTLAAALSSSGPDISPMTDADDGTTMRPALPMQQQTNEVPKEIPMTHQQTPHWESKAFMPSHHRPSTSGGSTRNNSSNDSDDVAHLMRLFHQIVQPPAAILIGGFERWRRLQHYLCKLGDKSRAVRSALLCLVELLVIDDDDSASRTQRMQRILERHATACQEIEAKLGSGADEGHPPLRPKTREHLLAAIFLLAWFEVIRDQDAHTSLFPRHLAERVITSATSATTSNASATTTTTSWSRYSQQLLSWLNTLDSKAAHMGRETLLSPKSLEAVAHFQVHITSSLEHGGCATVDSKTGTHDAEASELSSVDDMSPGSDGLDGHAADAFSSTAAVTSSAPAMSTATPTAAAHDTHPRLPPLGQVKQILLRTVLQPALEWYLTSQSYCRRISAHDKHHRRRFTSDDEYEVITACKQLEAELFELWDDRPAVMSLAAHQLRAVVAADLAKRLEEIFSVYLASFWILFVHLHRISWWNLPHSALARRALAEVWQHMQRAYGEEIQGPGPSVRKVIHPSLLWPLFLFGSECTDPAQAQWAIEQLEALGEAKPVLLDQERPGQPQKQKEATSDAIDDSNDTLPPFRLSSGATRNAKRAALLLRQLIKEQNTKQARVDDRDLSMRLFGCYFSII